MCDTKQFIAPVESLTILLANSMNQARAIERLAIAGSDLDQADLLSMVEAMSSLLKRALTDAHEKAENLWLELMQAQPEVQATIHEFREYHEARS